MKLRDEDAPDQHRVVHLPPPPGTLKGDLRFERHPDAIQTAHFIANATVSLWVVRVRRERTRSMVATMLVVVSPTQACVLCKGIAWGWPRAGASNQFRSRHGITLAHL